MDNGNVDSGNDFGQPPLHLPTLTPRRHPPPRRVHQWPMRRRRCVERGEQQQQERPEELSATVGRAVERDRGQDRPADRVELNEEISMFTPSSHTITDIHLNFRYLSCYAIFLL